MKKSTTRKTSAPRWRAAAKSKAARLVKTFKPVATPERRLLGFLVKALNAKKAEDLRVYYVGSLSSITDYLVLATATSDPHQKALRIELERVLDWKKVKILGIDAAAGSGWTVVDTFDVMVHVFTTESREKYRLDLLWKDAEEVPIAELAAV